MKLRMWVSMGEGESKRTVEETIDLPPTIFFGLFEEDKERFIEDILAGFVNLHVQFGKEILE